ncbi:mycofactocin-coupled SDR family oxidoreductase [Parafrankia discariae]|uniref:mycofactocin-coupled SDR family oxidoreductase n=1 Tax=Parafrankia discariae TaxID=365528 RepID=UPI00039AF005|nr:mycofactocin-coupled SDR family oxidoreductase [Parafrankia discariae]
MGRMDGKVVFITGAARGQGRAHAVRVAAEGGDVVAVDLCADIASTPYPMATRDDLDETARLVKERGGRVVAQVADVRDRAALAAAVAEGIAQFGRLDGVVAQAGICPLGTTAPQAFIDAVGVDFGGVFNAVDVALPHLLSGASIVATGSLAALIPGTLDSAAKGSGGLGYAWAKRAVASLVHDLAVVLAAQSIRVNAVHPTNVNTDMLNNDVMYRAFRPDLAEPTLEDVLPSFPAMTATGDPYVEPEDIADAVLFLLSDESRFITGTQLRVDAGGYVKLRPQAPAF